MTRKPRLARLGRDVPVDRAAVLAVVRGGLLALDPAALLQDLDRVARHPLPVRPLAEARARR